ncbi:protein phosphatase inhibitor 2-like [Tachypleus tridentatus]|uniref:protein phosphatase inhibitor 2-like n=1 Tax=Tachypleus tridentatus TaxID=6853 RepID=UPI003FD61775
MAELLSKKPAKSILKSSTSFEQPETQKLQDIQWDEMNILQTLHPPDKDYGHMKVNEPKTPFNYYIDEEGVEVNQDNEKDALDAALLTKKINLGSEKLPKAMMQPDEDDDDEDEYGDETEEERAKRKAFEYKRKIHYNEFYAVKLARKLMVQDEFEDEDDNDDENIKRDATEESQTKTTKTNGGSSEEELFHPSENTETSL